MNAIALETRLGVVGLIFLGFVVAALYLERRVARWMAAAAPRAKRRVTRAVLGFLLMHGITLTFGGFSFALFLLGLHDALPATDRTDFLRCMWVCFATGPTLALACWACLHLLHRRLAAG